jgi:hypothetical protein
MGPTHVRARRTHVASRVAGAGRVDSTHVLLVSFFTRDAWRAQEAGDREDAIVRGFASVFQT